jgi:hypothetical protein
MTRKTMPSRSAPARAQVARSVLLALGVTLAPLAHAQETPLPRVSDHELERLDALLRDLRALGPSIWQTKLARVERRIADHRTRAAGLRAEIEKLSAELARAEARATEAEAELLELRALAQHVHPGELPAVAVRVRATAEGESATALAQAAPAESPAQGSAPPAAPKAPAPSAPSSSPATPKAPAPEAEIAKGPPPSYAEHVLPIFEAACTVCHDDADAKGGQDLSSYEAALRGGSSGATIVPGNAEGSRLYRLTAHLEEPFMPKGRSALGAPELETLRRWIDAGAPRDAAAAKKLVDEAAAAAAKKREEPAAPSAATEAADGAAPDLDLPFHAVRTAAHPAPLTALAHAPAERLLAAAGVEQVLLLDPLTREIAGTLPFPGRVTRLEFSRDGELLLVAGGDAKGGGRAALFELRTGRELLAPRHGRDQLFGAALSPGRSLLALGGPTRRVEVLRTRDGGAHYELRGHGDWVLACAFSPDGNVLATADRGGAALVWQADTGRDVSALRGHEGAVQALAFTADAAVLVTLGEDGFACGWDFERGNRTWRTRVGAAPGTALCALADGSLLAAAGEGALLRFAGRDGKAQGKALPALGTWVASLAASTDGRRAYAGLANGELVEVDLIESRITARTRVVPLAEEARVPKG